MPKDHYLPLKQKRAAWRSIREKRSEERLASKVLRVAKWEKLLCNGIWPWGKHKGKKLKAVPLNYLEWAFKNADFKPIRNAAELELIDRGYLRDIIEP